MEPKMETRNIGKLHLRADIVPKSVDPEKRTVDVVWSTGAKVRKVPWFSDPWNEELSMETANIRMDRFNSGRSPFLANHSMWNLKDVLGVVQSAAVANGEGRATIRFSQRAEVDPIFKDVTDGILTNISVGYRVYKYEDVTENDDKIKTFRAVDWEPLECSLVPIGADPDASVRSAESPQDELNRCEIILRADSAPKNQEESAMEPKNEQGQPAVRNEAEPKTPVVDLAKVRAEAAEAERKRAADIRGLVRSVKLEEKVAEDLIAKGVDMDAARSEVCDLLAKASDDASTRSQNRVEVTRDAGESLRLGCEEALLARGGSMGPEGKPMFLPTERGNEFRSFSLMDFARAFAEEKFGRGATGRMSKMELAGAALGLRAGLHGTSDFPNILANVANKTLRKAYEYQTRTWAPITNIVEVPDFKTISRNQLGDAPSLALVPASGEITYGTISEEVEQYAVKTYAKIIGINRQVLINDDLQAFTRIPVGYAAAAASLESDLAWEQITSNPTLGDSVALFHATHANVGTGGVISVTTLGEARALMRKQVGLDGRKINVEGKFLLVPTAIETVADQFVSQSLLAAEGGKVNPFAGKLQVIAEPRLDDNSATKWYVAAMPGQVDVIELAYLQGQRGLYTETRMGFEVDGVEVKARLDVGAKVIDYRGLVSNAGV